MSDFSIYSIDWKTVSLLHGEHLEQETIYLEQMQRWGMGNGRRWGVAALPQNALEVTSSDTSYRINLKYCKAITKNGYLINLINDISLQGGNDSRNDSLLPIYLGAAIRKEPCTTAPQSAPLLESGNLEWRCILSCETHSSLVDWIQIGQMKREGSRFILDEQFIPRCVFLNSHFALSRAACNICSSAERILEYLEGLILSKRGPSEIVARMLLAQFATLLTPAAVIVNWEISPADYLERLLGVLRGMRALLHVVDARNAAWTNASDALNVAMTPLLINGRTEIGEGLAEGNIEKTQFLDQQYPGKFWQDSFERIRLALESIAFLCRELDTAAASSPPPVTSRMGETKVHVLDQLRKVDR